MKTPAIQRDTMIMTETIENLESNIVPGLLVGLARIAQPHQHKAGSGTFASARQPLAKRVKDRCFHNATGSGWIPKRPAKRNLLKLFSFRRLGGFFFAFSHFAFFTFFAFFDLFFFLAAGENR